MNIKFAPAMLAALAALAAGEATAQQYPSRPIRFLVGSPPGSGNDLVSRLLAQKLAERFGQSVIVEQKPGGAGLLANDALAKSPPDGYTLVLLSGAHPASAALNRALPYDPVRDFGMVGTVVAETLPGVEMSSWLGLAVPAATPRVIVDRLNREIRDFLESPEVRQRLADLSGVPTPSSPEEMRALVEREIARWKRVVELKNIERQN